MISLLPRKRGHITKLLYSMNSDVASIVAVWMFCFPFNVSVHRMMVCCINELKSTAGHTASDPPCHNLCSFSSGAFGLVKLFRAFDEVNDASSDMSFSCVWFSSMLTLAPDSDLEND